MNRCYHVKYWKVSLDKMLLSFADKAISESAVNHRKRLLRSPKTHVPAPHLVRAAATETPQFRTDTAHSHACRGQCPRQGVRTLPQGKVGSDLSGRRRNNRQPASRNANARTCGLRNCQQDGSENLPKPRDAEKGKWAVAGRFFRAQQRAEHKRANAPAASERADQDKCLQNRAKDFPESTPTDK